MRVPECGIVATGLNDLMKAAGLTHGGFYKHFASKDQLVAEATTAALDALLEGMAAHPTINAAVAAYLSTRHRDNPASGCPLAAIGSELPRSDEEGARGGDGGLREAGGHPRRTLRQDHARCRETASLDGGIDHDQSADDGLATTGFDPELTQRRSSGMSESQDDPQVTEFGPVGRDPAHRARRVSTMNRRWWSQGVRTAPLSNLGDGSVLPRSPTRPRCIPMASDGEACRMRPICRRVKSKIARSSSNVTSVIGESGQHQVRLGHVQICGSLLDEHTLDPVTGRYWRRCLRGGRRLRGRSIFPGLDARLIAPGSDPRRPS